MNRAERPFRRGIAFSVLAIVFAILATVPGTPTQFLGSVSVVAATVAWILFWESGRDGN